MLSSHKLTIHNLQGDIAEIFSMVNDYSESDVIEQNHHYLLGIYKKMVEFNQSLLREINRLHSAIEG